jgi:hypothetical protein
MHALCSRRLRRSSNRAFTIRRRCATSQGVRDATLLETRRDVCALTNGRYRAVANILRFQVRPYASSDRPASSITSKVNGMNNIVYIVGAVVIVLFILSFFGLR